MKIKEKLIKIKDGIKGLKSNPALKTLSENINIKLKKWNVKLWWFLNRTLPKFLADNKELIKAMYKAAKEVYIHRNDIIEVVEDVIELIEEL